MRSHERLMLQRAGRGESLDRPAAFRSCDCSRTSPWLGTSRAFISTVSVNFARNSTMIDTESRATAPTATPIPTPPANGTVTGLVSGILDDAQTLVRQQIEMLKAEVREDFTRSKQAAEFGALGIVLLTVGMLGLVTALANLLHEHYQFSMGASWGITGTLFTILGGAAAATSYLLLERFNPLPDKTFNALQENLSWKTTPKM
ncbi:MAG: hypothetical protein C0467_16520 [Planctomycetaceae bacterium]|nr:hypothetical protein [Planctomycetaceae bacterium]